jgi:hypothetical protein
MARNLTASDRASLIRLRAQGGTSAFRFQGVMVNGIQG